MPKNIMKVNIFEPYELKDTDIAKSHYNGRTNSNPSKYSFHFDTKLMGGSFWIEWEQLPQYVLDKTVLYRSKLGYKILLAPSVPELKKKIDDLFKAYMNEYSEIRYTKKIGLKLINNLAEMTEADKELYLGIKYMVFYVKEYLQDGEVIKKVSLKNKNSTSELRTEGFNIYDYTQELEDSVMALQENMHQGMKSFIAKMGSEKDILSHFQSHNLISK